MTTYTVTYGFGPKQATVTDTVELDRVLDEATLEASTEGLPGVVYIATGGLRAPMLVLGVGRDDFSFLSCEGGHASGNLDGGQPTAWYYAGDHHSEIPGGRGIPVKEAREAAREFVRSGGERPGNVEWVNEL